MYMPCKIKFLASNKRDQAGFTLVELMIAVFISGLVMAAVVSIYIAQSRSYNTQDDIANLQQNLRGALVILTTEIRLAGCDPTESKVPGIQAATGTNFRFTMDTKNTETPRKNAPDALVTGDEDIAYGFAAGVVTDINGRVLTGGQPWSGTASLGRQIDNAGGFEPLADNIEALEFNYILDDNTSTRTPTILNKIRAVQVSLLARATNQAPDFIHNNTYTTASGVAWTPIQDNFRRRLVITTIQCRNMR